MRERVRECRAPARGSCAVVGFGARLVGEVRVEEVGALGLHLLALLTQVVDVLRLVLDLVLALRLEVRRVNVACNTRESGGLAAPVGRNKESATRAACGRGRAERGEGSGAGGAMRAVGQEDRHAVLGLSFGELELWDPVAKACGEVRGPVLVASLGCDARAAEGASFVRWSEERLAVQL